MNKLINVLQATDVTDGPAVNRELVLVRVRVRTAEPDGSAERSRDFPGARGGFHHRRLSRWKRPATRKSWTSLSM